eukprot:s6273_g3.t1
MITSLLLLSPSRSSMTKGLAPKSNTFHYKTSFLKRPLLLGGTARTLTVTSGQRASTHGTAFTLLRIFRSTFAKAPVPVTALPSDLATAGHEQLRMPSYTSRVSKTELLAEASRIGVIVHHKWTCEEIKATIQEAREQGYTTMKSIASLTARRDENKGTWPWCTKFSDRVTKGNLIRQTRDQTSTAGPRTDENRQIKSLRSREIPRA